MEDTKKGKLASKIEVIVEKNDKTEDELVMKKWTERSDADDTPKFAQTLRDNVLRKLSE